MTKNVVRSQFKTAVDADHEPYFTDAGLDMLTPAESVRIPGIANRPPDAALAAAHIHAAFERVNRWEVEQEASRAANRPPEVHYTSDPHLSTAEWFRIHGAETDADIKAEFGGANRPPDAALDPVDVAELDRINALVDERNRLHEYVATLERHLERSATSAITWRNEALRYQRRFRRLIVVCCIVIPVVVVALWGRT